MSNANIGKALGTLAIDTNPFVKSLRDAKKEYAGFNKELSAAGNFNTALGNINKVGTNMTKYITIPLAMVAAQMIRTAADFEDGMRTVQAISGSTGQEFEKLSAFAVKLGKDTIYTARGTADAMTILAKAGWDAQNIFDGLQGVMMAATATGTDLAQTADVIVSTLNAFNMTASESTRVADVFTLAANRTNVDMQDLGESMKYLGPVAKSAGWSIEETSAAIGILGDAGIKGSMAGTTLRQAFMRMVNPTDKARAMMDELNISFYDGNKQMLSIADTVSMMSEATAGMSEEERNLTIATIFQTRALTGMNVLMNEGSQELRYMTAMLQDAEGAAQNTADVMMNDLQGQIELLKGSWESLSINIGTMFIPHIRNAVAALDEIVMAFNELPDGVQQAITVFLLFVAAAGPVLKIGSSMMTTFKGMSDVYKAIRTSVSAATAATTANTAATALNEKAIWANNITALASLNLDKAKLKSLQGTYGQLIQQLTLEKAMQITGKADLTYKQAKLVVEEAGLTAEIKQNAMKQANIAVLGAETAATIVDTTAEATNTAGVVAATGAEVAHTGAKTAGTIATNIASAATAVFGAVLHTALGPILLIVAGIAALVGIFYLFSKAVNNQSEEQKRYNEVLKETKEQTEENKKAMEEADAAYSEAQTEISNMREEAAILTNELQTQKARFDELAAAGEDTSVALFRMQSAAASLRDMGVDVAIDSLTGEIVTLGDSVEDAVEKMLKQEDAAAAAENYNTVIKAQADQQRIVTQATAELEKKQEELDAASENLTDTQKGYLQTLRDGNYTTAQARQAAQSLGGDVARLYLQERELAGALDEANAVLGEAQVASEEAAVDYAELAKAEEEAAEEARQLQEDLDISLAAEELGIDAQYIRDQMAETGGSVEEVVTQFNEQVEVFADSITGYFESATNGFSRLEQEATISLEEYMSNVQANIAAQESWNQNMAYLMDSGINAGIIAQLEKLGPAGADQAAAWVRELEGLKNGTTTTFMGVETDLEGALALIDDTMGTGFETATQSAIDEAERKDFTQALPNAVDNVAKDIVSKGPNLYRSSKTTFQEAKKAGDDVAKEFPAVGKSMDDGLIRGINDGIPAIENAARKAARAAYDAAMAELNSNSPSKLFRFGPGVSIPEGLALGITDGTDEVVESMQRLIQSAAGAATDISSSFTTTGSAIVTSDPYRYNNLITADGVVKDGSTYIFNGTQPLDEVEVERRIRTLNKQLAAGML